MTNRQYAVILDPVDKDGKPQLGRKKLVKGETSFFLMPGERLEKGIQNIFVLGEDEGLVLKASEIFKDGVGILLSCLYAFGEFKYFYFFSVHFRCYCTWLVIIKVLHLIIRFLVYYFQVCKFLK